LLLKHGLVDKKAEQAIKAAGALLSAEGASSFEQGEAKTLLGLLQQMGPDAPKSQ
jgi:hypothetical protein